MWYTTLTKWKKEKTLDHLNRCIRSIWQKTTWQTIRQKKPKKIHDQNSQQSAKRTYKRIKATREKPTSNIIITVEQLTGFPLLSGQGKNGHSLPYQVNTVLEVLARTIKKGKEV